MANTNAAFGFSPDGTVGGGTPNFRLSRRLIASNYGTKIFTGDAVSPTISTSTGYIVQAAATTTALAGIFMGCKYLSTSQGRQVWSQYWPGADATGDVTAYVIDNPDAQFVVQAGGTAIPFAAMNQNVQLNVGTGNTLTGRSGMYVENPTTTATLPFTIVGFVQDPPGVNGTDITTAYNWVRVTFNNEIFRAGYLAIA
jgi:hypothetical protein